MLTEEESESSSWEVRAEQLFNLCDRESKGFITKRDLQRLWGELPLGPDELEGVFDSLDQDHNGFLTLQEFTDGFGHHLGLVVEFRADCDSSKDSEEEGGEGGDEKHKNGGTESGNISSQQIDEILNCFAKHDFNVSPSLVESVWRDVCQSDAAAEDPSLGRLVTALLQELSRAKTEQTQLEAALNSKTEQYNLQVARLYEELESQISGERNKVEAERNEKGARALASLEQEMRDRENAFRVLQEDNAALLKKVETLTSLVTAGKQDNTRLMQHLSKLEEEYSLKEKEAEELASTLDHLRKSIKDEKRRRAQQALKVSEGIALERESLVTQLDLLRTINTELRDEHDQSGSATTNEQNNSKSLHQEQLTASAPILSKRNTVTFESTADIVTEKPCPPKTLPLPVYDGTERTLPDEPQSPTDFEHDETYFENSPVATKDSHMFPLLTPPPTEPSILQELLQHPCLCMSSEKNHCDSSESGHNAEPRVPLRRTDSITQTSPTLSLTKEQQFDGFSRKASMDASSPDMIMQAEESDESNLQQQDYSSTEHNDQLTDERNHQPPKEDSSIPTKENREDPSKGNNEDPGDHPREVNNDHLTKGQNDKPKSCLKKQKTPDIMRVCNCQREPPPHSSNFLHSTTIIHHPELSVLQPDLLPQTSYINQAFVFSQHTYHSHAYLPVIQMHSQSTATSSEDFPSEVSEQAIDECHLAGKLANANSSNNDSKTEEIKPLAKEKDVKNASDDAGLSDSGSHVAKMNNKNRKLRRQTSGSSRIGKADTGNMEDTKDDDLDTRADYQPPESSGVRIIPLSAVTTTRMFKIVFIGDSAVGKTTFIHRAAVGEFRNFSTTVGVDYRLMHICVGGTNALLQLWDTAGQERYRAITRQYYRKADCVVVMYDITCERSFLHVTDWISSVREYGDPNLVLAIIGNKKDLQKSRRVTVDNAYTLAKANDALLYEVSAAKGFGIMEVMKHLAGILTTDQEHSIDTSSTLTLHQSPNPRLNGKCCQ
ncbi:EF-hand calcium-binding domain-containing protein 4B-like [Macrobrachium nipponense]|uniref:EF-hand calcium-binding domain-containing protein 4B-like n=1 Tax=Macrobrachium nipponense TaxID=159736 RepID=UPI0030C7B1AC